MSKQPKPEQTTQCSTPYVYYSYEQWGRGYIGSRTAKGCYPEDEYLGSYYDKTFKPTDKIVLFEGTAEECLAVEVKLHEFFDVARNPHYANQARQTSTGFSTQGVCYSEEYREKQRVAQTGKKRTPETCENISAATTGKKKHLKPGSDWGCHAPGVAEAKREKMLQPERAEHVKSWRGAGTEAAAKKPRTQKQLDHVRALGKKPKSAETRRRMSEAAKRQKKKTE